MVFAIAHFVLQCFFSNMVTTSCLWVRVLFGDKSIMPLEPNRCNQEQTLIKKTILLRILKSYALWSTSFCCFIDGFTYELYVYYKTNLVEKCCESKNTEFNRFIIFIQPMKVSNQLLPPPHIKSATRYLYTIVIFELQNHIFQRFTRYQVCKTLCF